MASQALTVAALEIEHAPTGKKVQFFQLKMTGFSDTVTPSWSEESVYGRMDPLVTFQGTTRAIELSFDIGPFSESDDRKKLALQKISRLMQFQYPTYSTEKDAKGNAISSATSISRPPLLKVSFANYIRAGSGTNSSLLCYMAGMSYNPVDGMSAVTTPKVVADKNPTILPQRIAVTLSLKVLHETAPGWNDSDNEWAGGDFWGPYKTPKADPDKKVTSGVGTLSVPTDIPEAEKTALEKDLLKE